MTRYERVQQILDDAIGGPAMTSAFMGPSGAVKLAMSLSH